MRFTLKNITSHSTSISLPDSLHEQYQKYQSSIHSQDISDKNPLKRFPVKQLLTFIKDYLQCLSEALQQKVRTVAQLNDKIKSLEIEIQVWHTSLYLVHSFRRLPTPTLRVLSRCQPLNRKETIKSSLDRLPHLWTQALTMKLQPNISQS